MISPPQLDLAKPKMRLSTEKHLNFQHQVNEERFEWEQIIEMGAAVASVTGTQC